MLPLSARRCLIGWIAALLSCGDDADGAPAASSDETRAPCEIWRDIGAAEGCARTGCELAGACDAQAEALLLCVERDTAQCLCEADGDLNCEGAWKPDEGLASCSSEFAAFETCMDGAGAAGASGQPSSGGAAMRGAGVPDAGSGVPDAGSRLPDAGSGPAPDASDPPADAGAGDASAAPDPVMYAGAAEFCDSSQRICGFGRVDTFADREDCEEDYVAKFSVERRACAATALAAAADDPAAHCAEAKGDGACRL